MWPFSNNLDPTKLGVQLSEFFNQNSFSSTIEHLAKGHSQSLTGELRHSLILEMALLRLAILNNLLFVVLGPKNNKPEDAYMPVFEKAVELGKITGFQSDWIGSTKYATHAAQSKSTEQWSDRLKTQFLSNLTLHNPRFTQIIQVQAVELQILGIIQATMNKLEQHGFL